MQFLGLLLALEDSFWYYCLLEADASQLHPPHLTPPLKRDLKHDLIFVASSAAVSTGFYFDHFGPPDSKTVFACLYLDGIFVTNADVLTLCNLYDN